MHFAVIEETVFCFFNLIIFQFLLGNSNFIPITVQARSLSADKLRVVYISINAAVYFIQVSVSFSFVAHKLYIISDLICSILFLEFP